MEGGYDVFDCEQCGLGTDAEVTQVMMTVVPLRVEVPSLVFISQVPLIRITSLLVLRFKISKLRWPF